MRSSQLLRLELVAKREIHTPSSTVVVAAAAAAVAAAAVLASSV